MKRHGKTAVVTDVLVTNISPVHTEPDGGVYGKAAACRHGHVRRQTAASQRIYPTTLIGNGALHDSAGSEWTSAGRDGEEKLRKEKLGATCDGGL